MREKRIGGGPPRRDHDVEAADACSGRDFPDAGGTDERVSMNGDEMCVEVGRCDKLTGQAVDSAFSGR
jgi:hypothetical protein